MFKMISNILKPFNKYYLLGMYVSDDTEFVLLEVLYQNDEFQIVNKTNSNTLSTLDNFNNNYPVTLHIEGDPVITKQVDNISGYRNDLIFKANPEEFLFYEYVQDTAIYASVIRRDYMDKCIQDIKNLGRNVTHTSFGPFVTMHSLLVSKGLAKLSTPYYSLLIEEGLVSNYTRNDVENGRHHINKDVFNERELPLFGSFIESQFSHTSITNDQSFLNANIEDQKYSTLFKLSGAITLIFFLLALFVGHFILGHYTKALSEKQADFISSQQLTSQLEAIKKEKNLKENILLTSGIKNSVFLTKYLTDIGNSSPKSVTLNTIDIFPLRKKIRDNDKIGYNLNSLQIIGESLSDSDFNDWIEALRTLNWVKNVQITNYNQESKTNNSFKLTIII